MTRLPTPEDLGPVDYSSNVPPPRGYHCGKCGVLGVKLWRDYNVFMIHQSLLCAQCACVEQSNERKSYDIRVHDNGKVSVTTTYSPVTEPVLWKFYRDGDEGGDQIGWRVPAIPTACGTSYWRYSSVPIDARDWWFRLPIVGRDQVLV